MKDLQNLKSLPERISMLIRALLSGNNAHIGLDQVFPVEQPEAQETSDRALDDNAGAT